MGHFLAALLAKLFADEVKAWLPFVAERLRRVAIRLVPPDQQERLSEEWSSYLEALPGGLAKVWEGFGFIRAAREISGSRILDFSRIAAVILYPFPLPIIFVMYVLGKYTSRDQYEFTLRESDEFSTTDITQYSPIGALLRCSLQPDLPMVKIFKQCSGHAIWRGSFGEIESLMSRKLANIHTLGCVILGRISIKQWIDFVVEDFREPSEGMRIATKNGPTVSWRDYNHYLSRLIEESEARGSSTVTINAWDIVKERGKEK
jgi:hypothetical protein